MSCTDGAKLVKMQPHQAVIQPSCIITIILINAHFGLFFVQWFLDHSAEYIQSKKKLSHCNLQLLTLKAIIPRPGVKGGLGGA